MQTLSNNELSEENIDWPVNMRRAIELAGRVITATPNPRVGCVLVKDGVVVGEGWHIAAGEDHAEVMALNKAGEQAHGATVFVSLEPCSHTGRTGPCTDVLLEAGVAEVVIAGIDPDPKVSGKGVAALEGAGISVVHLVDFEGAARAINPGYIKRQQLGLPYVCCKLAMSLDGRTALANGESKWISSAAARADVQKQRARSSAIVTGIGTVLADDPLLNLRPEELDLDPESRARNKKSLARQPLRIVLDSHLRTPAAARIIAADGEVKIYTVNAVPKDQAFPDNVEVVQATKAAASVSLQFVLESLASKFACNEVLVEAGSTLSSAFIQAGLVDELLVYIAPRLLGSDAKALFDRTGLQSLADSVDFEVKDLDKVGGDIRVTLVPVCPAE
ncbi:MAG: bifunctional diaminohydroxyphosphoribosylaminopyrimidine deaminase/5-amino-6-(5-phosphoribosylamino)uracil reductase RibD [Proteobacteria bacterium]|nr:bifunctional diaminohydroxyphosphoribosylaminopyrimidine deaminase/5-amino-6-(5-phosphoribosylamino)uracil reductase RibD [Pseudomonadota bacterium]